MIRNVLSILIVGVCSYCYCKFLKLNNYAKMIAIVCAIALIHTSLVGIYNFRIKAEQKIEAFNKRVDDVTDKINGVNQATTDPTLQKGIKAIKDTSDFLDKADELDKKIKKKGFEIREKILGKGYEPVK